MTEKKQMTPEVIGEGEVLVATLRYLFKIGSTPTHISVPHGKGIDSLSIQEEVKDVIQDESLTLVEPKFEHSGPDIVAVSDDMYWKIECKGYGTGKPQTHRNNFDRALASVVSYYEDDRPIFLGLALPATKQYKGLLQRRAGKPLRKKLNLWVLLNDQGQIKPIEPNEDYPW